MLRWFLLFCRLW